MKAIPFSFWHDIFQVADSFFAPVCTGVYNLKTFLEVLNDLKPQVFIQISKLPDDVWEQMDGC